MDEQFIAVLGAIGTVVVLAAIVERVLAFVFEYEWFGRLFLKPDGRGDSGVSRIPGLKALIALAFSMGIVHQYDFDLLSTLLGEPGSGSTLVGTIVTAFVVAGGSSGAVSVFQAHLKFGKATRDAAVAAANAEASLKEAEAKRNKAEAAAAIAAAGLAQAKAELETAQTKAAAADV